MAKVGSERTSSASKFDKSGTVYDPRRDDMEYQKRMKNWNNQ